MFVTRYQLSDTEIEALDELLEACKLYDGGAPPVYKHVLILKRETPCTFLYYSPEKKLIGFLSLYFFYENKCEISLIVHPQYRKKGIGKELFEASKTYLHGMKYLAFGSGILKDDAWQKEHGVYLEHTEYHLTRELLIDESTCHSLQVSPAQTEHLSLLSELDKACFDSHDDEMKARLEFLLSDEHYTLLVAYLNHQIIGKCHLRFDEEETVLSDLAIFPAYQKQGFGTELLKQSVNYALKKQSLPISLEVESKQASVLPFYLKCHFQLIYQTFFYLKENAN